METLISPEKASEILGVTEKSLANSRYTGTGLQVPYIKLGKIIRYKESELETYIEANTHQYTGEAKEDA